MSQSGRESRNDQLAYAIANLITACREAGFARARGDRVEDATKDEDAAIEKLRSLILSESGRMAEAERLLGEWLKKSDAHRPEIQEFKGGYQPFLERATRYFLDACKRNEPEWP